MIQKILFPIDFSPPCIAMAAYVRRAAEIFHAEVSILHVCDLESHNGFELYSRAPDDIAADHWKVAQIKLDGFLQNDFPPSSCPRILLAGHAANKISETAGQGKFDLIMMPTHATRFQRMLLGSTAAKVLDQAGCPVLTGQHSVNTAPHCLEHRKWICAVSLSADSERVLRYARDAALAAGAKLSIIHAIDQEMESPIQDAFLKEREASRRIDQLQGAVGSDASVYIKFGQVKEALLDTTWHSRADVLVIGRASDTSSSGRMEDFTYSLIRDASCPVVSV